MTILFKEDFENDLSQFDSLTQINGTVEISPEAALFGTKGLKCVVNPVASSRACVVKLINATTLHVRGYFKIPAGLPEGGLSLISVMNSTKAGSPGVIRFRNVNGVNKLEAVYYRWDEPTVKWVQVNYPTTPDIVFDSNKTYLLEMRIAIGTAGQLKIWVDENPVIDITLDNSLHISMSEVRTGLVFASPTTSITVYHDEFAIGDSYIGPVGTPQPPPQPWNPMLIAGVVVASILGIGALIYVTRRHKYCSKKKNHVKATTKTLRNLKE